MLLIESPPSSNSLEVPVFSDLVQEEEERRPPAERHYDLSPPLHLPVPHALVVQDPRSQTIILQPSDPAIVGHAQLAKHAAALPDDDRRVEVFGWRSDKDLLRVLG